MSSRCRLINRLRREPWYPLVVRTMSECGIDDYHFEPAMGKGHPKLIFGSGKNERRIPVPTSGKGRSNYVFLALQIRRQVATMGEL